MLRLIPKTGARINTSRLLLKFYPEGVPPNGRKQLNGLVTGLVNKTAKGHCYRVCRSARSGPKPMEVWVEKT